MPPLNTDMKPLPLLTFDIGFSIYFQHCSHVFRLLSSAVLQSRSGAFFV